MHFPKEWRARSSWFIHGESKKSSSSSPLYSSTEPMIESPVRALQLQTSSMEAMKASRPKLSTPTMILIRMARKSSISTKRDTIEEGMISKNSLRKKKKRKPPKKKQQQNEKFLSSKKEKIKISDIYIRKQVPFI